MLMLDCTTMTHTGCFLAFHTTKELHTEALLIASVATGSFQARPRGELAGWKKRWQIHARILRASAAEVLRLQKIDTEPDRPTATSASKRTRTLLRRCSLAISLRPVSFRAGVPAVTSSVLSAALTSSVSSA